MTIYLHHGLFWHVTQGLPYKYPSNTHKMNKIYINMLTLIVEPNVTQVEVVE